MNRTIAFMQPYWFPYLGYFQLIAASDTFVLADHLQYMERGWVNRNRVLCGGRPQTIQMPLRKGHHTDAINQRWLAAETQAVLKKLLRSLNMHYAKAPQHKPVMALLERCLLHPEQNLSRYLEFSLREVCAYLGIHTPILNSSELDLPEPLEMTQRILHVVQRLDGQRYLNAEGGSVLYHERDFQPWDIELRFLRMDPVTYPQLGQPFVSHLSIIDVLMFNSIEQVHGLLGRYQVLCNDDFIVDAHEPSGLPSLA